MYLSQFIAPLNLLAMTVRASYSVHDLYARSFDEDEHQLAARSIDIDEYFLAARGELTDHDLLPRDEREFEALHRRAGGGPKVSPKNGKPKNGKIDPCNYNAATVKAGLAPDMQKKVGKCIKTQQGYQATNPMGTGAVGPCGDVCGAITMSVQDDIIKKACPKDVKANIVFSGGGTNC